MPGKEQMAHDHPSCDHSPLVKRRETRLGDHFLKSRFRRLHIIRRTGIRRGQLRIHVLEIRQIDVHQAGKHSKGFRLLITATVVHHRDPESMFFCQRKRRHNLRDKMSGRHQVDVICFLILKFQHDLRKTLCRNLFAALPSGNAAVLAEDTSKRTSGEKHGSRSFASGNTGFLPHVKRGPGDQDLRARAAVPLLSGQPVCPAVSGTETAVLHQCFYIVHYCTFTSPASTFL